MFLDRDGVIVEDVHYLAKVSDVRVIPGTAAGIRELNARGIPVIVVTNQSGIGRGYYDWATFADIQHAILSELARDGAKIDMVLACAYHEAGQEPFCVPNHEWRKPNPGMLMAAAEALGCRLAESVIVGDRLSDLEAGARAGLRRGMLVETGYGVSAIAELRKTPVAGLMPTTASNLAAAIRRLLDEGWA
jgi:D-glycero-D-manno-heptose 1,7-bisphosphate phosphatase